MLATFPRAPAGPQLPTALLVPPRPQAQRRRCSIGATRTTEMFHRCCAVHVGVPAHKSTVALRQPTESLDAGGWTVPLFRGGCATGPASWGVCSHMGCVFLAPSRELRARVGMTAAGRLALAAARRQPECRVVSSPGLWRGLPRAAWHTAHRMPPAGRSADRRLISAQTLPGSAVPVLGTDTPSTPGQLAIATGVT